MGMQSSKMNDFIPCPGDVMGNRSAVTILPRRETDDQIYFCSFWRSRSALHISRRVHSAHRGR